MRRMATVLMVLWMLGGCTALNAKPMRAQLLTPPKEWVALYGDSEQSQVYYNLAALRAVLNQHAKVINALATTRPTTQPTTQTTQP